MAPAFETNIWFFLNTSFFFFFFFELTPLIEVGRKVFFIRALYNTPGIFAGRAWGLLNLSLDIVYKFASISIYNRDSGAAPFTVGPSYSKLAMKSIITSSSMARLAESGGGYFPLHTGHHHQYSRQYTGSILQLIDPLQYNTQPTQ